MVEKNNLTVCFIKATDFIKYEKSLTHGDIAKSIGVSRSKYDMIRTKRRHPSIKDVNNLLQLYPEVSSFFDEENFKSPKDQTSPNDKYLKTLEEKDELQKKND